MMKKLILTLLFATIATVSFGQTNTIIQARSNGASQLRLESNIGGELFDLRVNNDGILRFIANGSTEAMQIDDDTRNVGVGIGSNDFVKFRSNFNTASSDPQTGLQGDAQGSGTGSRFGVFGTASNNTGNRYGVYGSSATGTGRWGVYCSGNFYHTGSFTSTSDGRLKTNTKSLVNGLDLVMKLKPKTYQFKNDIKGIELSKGPQIGFVAQELEKVIPELVSTDMHDMIDESGKASGEQMEIKGINYLGIIPVLTKAIQDQQELILKLEARITQLEKSK